MVNSGLKGFRVKKNMRNMSNNFFYFDGINTFLKCVIVNMTWKIV